MLQIIIFLFFVIQTSCHCYLNNLQISYIRNILTNPRTPDDIRSKTKQILFHEYTPWLKKQVRTFIKNNKKGVNFIMEIELHQYAIIGFLKAIEKFDGKNSLIQYAEKFVKGELSTGVINMTPLKPINKYQKFIKKERVLRPTIISYENFWMFDKFKQYYNEKNPKENNFLVTYTSQENDNECFIYDNSNRKAIRNAVLEMLPEYQQIFFARYDFETLRPIKSVYRICRMFQFSDQTYRRKMNVVKKYLFRRIRKMVF
jgi:hypothetical protein